MKRHKFVHERFPVETLLKSRDKTLVPLALTSALTPRHVPGGHDPHGSGSLGR
jgi:hypothetical protein